MSVVTREEMETTINILYTETNAEIYSCIPAQINKLRKLEKEHPEECIKNHEDSYGVCYTVPKSWIKISPPRKMSDEQRQKAAERLKNYRNSLTDGYNKQNG